MGCGMIRYLHALCYDWIRVSSTSLSLKFCPAWAFGFVLSQATSRLRKAGFVAPHLPEKLMFQG